MTREEGGTEEKEGWFTKSDCRENGENKGYSIRKWGFREGEAITNESRCTVGGGGGVGKKEPG